MTIAKDCGIKVIKKRVKLPEFLTADEAFLVGTATEVAPIGKVKGKQIGRGGVGPVTALLKEAYLDAAHGKISRYTGWLSYVKSL
jgi:branched-chain amino acid aminotransferase